MTEITPEEEKFLGALLAQGAANIKAQKSWPSARELWNERDHTTQFITDHKSPDGLMGLLVIADTYYAGRGLKPGRVFVGREQFAQRGNLRDYLDPNSEVLEAKGRVGYLLGVEVCVEVEGENFLVPTQVVFQPQV